MSNQVTPWPHKRYIIGPNVEGKSCVLDDIATNIVEQPGHLHRVELWHTGEMPVDNSIANDRSLGSAAREPEQNGTLFRGLKFWPEGEDTQKTHEAVQHTKKLIQQKHVPSAEDLARHPTMHRTDTIDYITCIEGEIWLMTDTDEVLMKEGDTVVITGMNHGWSNRSDSTALLAVCMVQANPATLTNVDPKVSEPLNVAGVEKDWKYKRYVIRPNAAGRSYTATDKISKIVEEDSVIRGILWSTSEISVNNDIPGDRALETDSFLPPPNGSVSYSMQVLPGTGKKELTQTDTLDCCICIDGEVWLETETGGVLLQQGDAAVIRGVRHAWCNRGDKPCLLNCFIVDAKPMV